MILAQASLAKITSEPFPVQVTEAPAFEIMPIKMGFVGGGMMAEAMLKGMLEKGIVAKESVTIAEIVEGRRNYMAETYSVNVTGSVKECFGASDVVVLAVKPQSLDSAAEEATQCNYDKKLIISILAGKTLADIQSKIPGCRLARVMPNTPAMVGCGASAYVLSPNCTDEHAANVESILSAFGIAERLSDEKLMDAVTGLSGSGPAYVYLLIEAMSDGGVRMGLPRAIATRLAAQTVLGAGQMVINTGKHPGELKDAVTSPAGTTIAGVGALEAGAFRGTVMSAVEAATKRSQELAKI